MLKDTSDQPEPANIKLLRRLVLVLLLTMIVGFVILIGLFIVRFQSTTTPTIYSELPLPDGAVATGYSEGKDWFAVITDQNEILIFNTDRTLRQRIKIQSQ